MLDNPCFGSVFLTCVIVTGYPFQGSGRTGVASHSVGEIRAICDNRRNKE